MSAGCAGAAGLAITELSGVGVGVSGFIDALRGFVYWSPSIIERNIPLGTLLSREFGLPFFIDNDVNLVAMAEQLFGYGRQVSDYRTGRGLWSARQALC